MIIRDIFNKKIDRPINGVVKADQLNQEIVWRELSEYVLTGELDKHFRRFFRAWLDVAEAPHDPTLTSRMGVWISGFFGSGKSHFLKILSYLLGAKEAVDPESGQAKKAIDFFVDKIKDAMLLGDIRRATLAPTDVVLFNIDSKADKAEAEAALLSVFWRVFNELQGFCPKPQHVAELERFVAKKGKLAEFHQRFAEVTGETWIEQRDSLDFYREEAAEALALTFGKSREVIAEWLEKIEISYSFSIEIFAARVKEYLDAKGPQHRIVFLVDEVGQFIGGNSQLMLNLQTIAEQLGTHCGGRAWVVVTSQEDIDAVIEGLNRQELLDYSKIQGRFATRLSLSSSNADEVIQRRLLEKTPACLEELRALFRDKDAILRNQLGFTSDCATLKRYEDEDDFALNYPFAPFQFQLLQKVFEGIRRRGVAGLHLASGERSMLDAFQTATINIAHKPVGALAPLHEFYACIESFLDTTAKRCIDHASENKGLSNPFDAQLLKTLFLIRYVDILSPNAENLVTLCIEQVDADRLALKRNIHEGLHRLEKESLVSRNGDRYYFLTDEEREVAREIKSIRLSASEEIQFISEILFDHALKQKDRHRYTPFKRDYDFARICDGVPYRSKTVDMTVELVSPLHEQYSLFNEDTKCVMYSTGRPGQLLVKLPDRPALVRELRAYLQTDRFILQKSDASASLAFSEITRRLQTENQHRKNRLATMLVDMLASADYYERGKKLAITATNARAALEQALDLLVLNLYSKFGYLTTLHENPEREVRQTLLLDDAGQHALRDSLPTINGQALKELRNWVDLKIASNQPVMLAELVAHFGKAPYGWAEWELVLLVARMFMADEAHLLVEATRLTARQAAEHLGKRQQWKNVKLVRRKAPRAEDIQAARTLGRQLFGAHGPDKQDELCDFLKTHFTGWKRKLDTFHAVAGAGDYPGGAQIERSRALLGELIAIRDPYELILGLMDKKDELIVLSDDFHDLQGFYETQIGVWKHMVDALHEFKPNQTILAESPDVSPALRRLNEIREDHAPYGQIKGIPALVSKVRAANETKVSAARKKALKVMDARIERVKTELAIRNAGPDLCNLCLFALQNQRKSIENEQSIPSMHYMLAAAEDALTRALEQIEDAFADAAAKAKPVKIITPAQLAPGVYFESEEEVERFVETLRKEMLAAVRRGKRVKVE